MTAYVTAYMAAYTTAYMTMTAYRAPSGLGKGIEGKVRSGKVRLG